MTRFAEKCGERSKKWVFPKSHAKTKSEIEVEYKLGKEKSRHKISPPPKIWRRAYFIEEGERKEKE